MRIGGSAGCAGKTPGDTRAGVNAVKSELTKGRGVAATFKADTASPGEVSPEPLMNEKTWAHYTYKDIAPTHMICIVGWSDSYPKDNFNAEH